MILVYKQRCAFGENDFFLLITAYRKREIQLRRHTGGNIVVKLGLLEIFKTKNDGNNLYRLTQFLLTSSL